MSKLDGRVAIVTGASKGIGASIAQNLASAGAAVVVNYADSHQDADRVVSGILGAGGKAVAIQGDVTNAEDARRIVNQAIERFGRLDILVNNVGRYEFVPLDKITKEMFDKYFSVNVFGTLQMTREAVRFMKRGASIVNISSIASKHPSLNSTIYSATKAAVDSITASLSIELGALGIRINALNPGMVNTEGFKAAGFLGSDWHKEAVKVTPLGRIAEPIDIAKVAVFLASEDSGWITGESILVSGGRR